MMFRSSRNHRPLAGRAASLLLALAIAFATAPFATPAVAVNPGEAVSASAVTSANLKCVHFVSPTVGYAGGTAGTILKTTDAGLTWSTVRSGDTLDIRSIDFWDADNGRAVSLNGVVLGTSDGGDTWSTVNGDLGGELRESEQIFDAAFPNATKGFALGWSPDTAVAPPLVFHSEDSGSTWPLGTVFIAGEYDPPPDQNPYPKDGYGSFRGVDFVGDSRGWAVGVDQWVTPNKSVIYDYDSGRSWPGWVKQTVTGSATLLDVSFASTDVGVAVGTGGALVRTINSGTSWASVSSGVTSDLNGVDLGTNGWGWAVGASGRIVYTSNYGETWTVPAAQTGAVLEDVAWLEGTKGVAVGSSGTVLLTTNGIDWSAPPDPPVVTNVWSTTHPAGTWVADTNAGLAWQATPTGGITGYSIAFDQNPTTTPDTVVDTAATSTSVTASGSGTWYMHVRATDSYGRWSAPFHRAILVDVTDPMASDDVDPGGYEAQAYVTLSGSDAHSGLDAIEYSLDGGPDTTYTAPILVEGVRDHDLSYWAIDNAGNISDPTDVVVTINPATTPHMLSLTSSTHPVDQWVADAEVSFSWSATSSVPIDGYSYDFDQLPTTTPDEDADPVTTSAVVTANDSGTWYMHVRAKDTFVPARWSDAIHRQVKVDVTDPVASDNISASAYTDSATVTLTASDAHSGLSHIEYQVDGGSRSTYTGAVTITGVGSHTLRYWAVDNVGNESDSGVRSLTIQASPTDPPTDPIPVPVAGADRYTTAVAASKLAFPTGLPAGPDGNRWVVLASGATWPDALAASGLAGAAQCPLLLTRPGELPAAVSTEVARLGADRVLIVGGTGAVSSAVQAAVSALPGIGQVRRLGGADRYATAQLIADEVVSFPGRDGWNGTAFIGTGLAFPDALAAAPVATFAGDPLYLAPRGTLPASIIAAMKADNVQRVVILGGTGAVSAASEQALNAAFGAANVDRRGGADRYATAVAVADFGVSAGLDWSTPAIATGENFPDALAGGVMQGHAGSVLLLTRTATLSPATGSALAQHDTEIREVRFLGGEGALSTSVRSAVMDASTP